MMTILQKIDIDDDHFAKNHIDYRFIKIHIDCNLIKN